MSGDDEGFVSRWSRRKRSAPEVDQEGAEPASEAEAPSDDPPRSDADILTDLGLPDPDLLEPGDSFAGFLRKEVPRHLQQRAMRRLWRSNPVLANIDGLNDYDGDFTGGGKPAEVLKTAYRVGRGFLPDTGGDAAPEPRDDEPASDKRRNVKPQDTDPPDPETSADSFSPEPDERENRTKQQETTSSPARRRMAFRFPDDT